MNSMGVSAGRLTDPITEARAHGLATVARHVEDMLPAWARPLGDPVETAPRAGSPVGRGATSMHRAWAERIAAIVVNGVAEWLPDSRQQKAGAAIRDARPIAVDRE